MPSDSATSYSCGYEHLILFHSFQVHTFIDSGLYMFVPSILCAFDFCLLMANEPREEDICSKCMSRWR